jgi:hypothetical protein
MKIDKRLSQLEQELKPTQPDVDLSILTDDELAFFRDVLKRTNGRDFDKHLSYKEFFTFKELYNKCYEDK